MEFNKIINNSTFLKKNIIGQPSLFFKKKPLYFTTTIPSLFSFPSLSTPITNSIKIKLTLSCHKNFLLSFSSTVHPINFNYFPNASFNSSSLFLHHFNTTTFKYTVITTHSSYNSIYSSINDTHTPFYLRKQYFRTSSLFSKNKEKSSEKEHPSIMKRKTLIVTPLVTEKKIIHPHEKKKEIINIANFVTSLRIVFSMSLLFYPTFSLSFYTLYIMAGISDMIDGTIARKTNTVTEFGSKMDTIADSIMVIISLIKMIPVLHLSYWVYLWITGIFHIKVMNIIFGYIIQKKFIVDHSGMNKVTGVLLFLLPLTINFINLNYSAFIVCTFATIAAIQEGYSIIISKNNQEKKNIP